MHTCGPASLKKKKEELKEIGQTQLIRVSFSVSPRKLNHRPTSNKFVRKGKKEKKGRTGKIGGSKGPFLCPNANKCRKGKEKRKQKH